ncbi:MAG: hypothetical protein WCH40_13755 [Verrucomicrobiales bacterium]
MSRRRSTDSSLDLLLDTITNTFGGVLFLAMLVSLMLSTTPREHSPAPNDAVAHARLEVELESLRQRADDLRSHSRISQVQSPDPDGVHAPLAETLLRDLLAAIEERATVIESTSQHQTATASSESRARVQAEETTKSKKALEDVTTTLEKERSEADRLKLILLGLASSPAPDLRTVGLPRLTETDKTQVTIMLRYGRLYMMHRWHNGLRMGPNTDDFIVIPGPPQVAWPRPSAGFPVEQSSIANILRRLLAPFPPNRWVVAAIVHADSFDSFSTLRKALVDAGYSYGPIPVGVGGSTLDAGGKAEGQ